MTSKEKANELVDKFDNFDVLGEDHNGFTAQQCALIAVDEIMEFMKMDDEYTETSSNANSKWVYYWQEVKQEIEKL